MMFFRQIFQNVFLFVPLTALDERLIAKTLLDRFSYSFAAVDHTKKSVGIIQTPFFQPFQHILDWSCVFSGSLDKTERDLVTGRSHTKANNDLFLGKVFSVDEDVDNVQVCNRPILKFLQFFFGTFNKRTGDRAFRQPKTFTQRIDHPAVITHTEAQKNAFEQLIRRTCQFFHFLVPLKLSVCFIQIVK